MKKLLGLVTAISLLIGVSTLAPAITNAALLDGAKTEACKAVNLSDDPAAQCDPESGNKVSGVLQTGLHIFSIIVGIIAVIMLIVNGLRFVMSQGDATTISSARNGIIYAIVGIIVVVLAQTLIRFVLNRTNDAIKENNGSQLQRDPNAQPPNPDPNATIDATPKNER